MEQNRIALAIERAYQAQEELKKAMFELSNAVYEDTQNKALSPQPQNEIRQQGLTLTP
jgi:hypothetical protein